MLFFFYLLFSTFCWDSTAGLVVLWKFIHSTESAKNIFSDKHNDKCVLYVIQTRSVSLFWGLSESVILLRCSLWMTRDVRTLYQENFYYWFKGGPGFNHRETYLTLPFALTVPAEILYLDFSVFLFRKAGEQNQQIIVDVGCDLAPWLLLLWNRRE